MSHPLHDKVSKSSLDQHFTPDSYAKHCLILMLKSGFATSKFCEPANGGGAFGNLLPVKALRFDIEPQTADTVQGDFLKMTSLDLTGYTVIGNPPFGGKKKTDLAFINAAAERGADVIAFILPRSFRKASVINRIHRSYHLAHDEDTPHGVTFGGGADAGIRCCFQVWVRAENERELIDTCLPDNPWLRSVTREEANCCLVVHGSRAGIVEHVKPEHSDQGYCVWLKVYSVDLLIMLSHTLRRNHIIRNTVSIQSITLREFYDAVSPYLQEYDNLL